MSSCFLMAAMFTGLGGLGNEQVLAQAVLPTPGDASHAGHQHAPAAPAGGAATQPSGPVGKIACDAPEYEFPEVWAGEEIKHTFVIRNIGEGPLEISRVQPSCGCTLAGEFDRKIEPGKTGNVPIALRTTGFRGAVTKTITVYSNDPTQPQFRLTLKGNVKQAIDMKPLTGFHWSPVTPQSPDSITITLTNNLEEPWKLALKPDPSQKVQQEAFAIELKEIEPGRKAEVICTLKKPVKEGSVATYFTFTTGLSKQPELRINANYYLPPTLQVMPASLDGYSTAGQEYRRMLSLQYNREGELKILEVIPSDPAIKTEVNQPNPADARRYTITVTLPPDFESSPSKPASIKIKTDKTDVNGNNVQEGVVTVPINIRPRVVQPTAQQMVGKPAPQFTLKTPEDAQVTIGGSSDQISVVNFWATWCGYCKRQVPVVSEVYKSYHGKGVRFLNVCIDTQKAPKEVAETSKQLGSEVPVALDPKGEAATKWGARGWPALFIVDRKGTIVAFHGGAKATLAEDLKKDLDLLLAGKELPGPAAPTPPAATVQERLATQPAAQPKVEVQGPALVIDSLRQDLGQRKPGETAQYSLNVRNNGSEAVNITGVKPGSDAVKVVGDPPGTVSSGTAAMIRFEVKVPTKPGAFEETVTIQSSDPKRPQQLVTLAGTVRNYVEVQTTTGDGVINFPRNPRTQDMPTMATLVYNGEGQIEYSTPTSSSPKFEASIDPIPNTPYAKLTVRTRPPLEQGENNAILHVKTTCKEQPELEIPVRFYVPPRIEVSPKEVSLTPTGRLQRQLVMIRNNSDRPLSVLGLEASSKRITWQFWPESDGLSYKLMLTVPAMQPGQQEPAPEQVTIRTDDPEFKEIVIPIKYNGSAEAGKQTAAH